MGKESVGTYPSSEPVFRGGLLPAGVRMEPTEARAERTVCFVLGQFGRALEAGYSKHARVFLCREPMDCSNSIDVLSYLVRLLLGQSPVSAYLFVFVRCAHSRVEGTLMR